jgi:uncharacterized membrane protein
MPDKNEKIDELGRKLTSLLQKQEIFGLQINSIQQELEVLKAENILAEPIEEEALAPEPEMVYSEAIEQEPVLETVFADSSNSQQLAAPLKYNLEKFIGENLINKIGIIILVIGVAIGAKYSIDHDLISPLGRILFGYLAGLGLLGAAIKLKPKYENFSAVLLSGAMANLYFITYAAYSFYNLIPQSVTFAMMVAFTGFTVAAALNYNRQIIALFGLVGAYAVPFLLSDGSGRVAILFSYMLIINCGILALSFKKYWKGLFYSAFALTWLIYFGWYLTQFSQHQHFNLAQVFSFLFFSVFYVTFLAYKIVKKEKFEINDILVMLVNSFLYYGLGYTLLNNHTGGEEFLGLFTLGNALVHFVACSIIYRNKLADRNLFYLVSGLVLVFITLAIPVQLDGNWVTLLWAAEALLLFWIGRTKNAPIYEWLSYPVMFIAFVSLGQDWATNYMAFDAKHNRVAVTPFLNITFASAAFFIACFAVINRIHFKKIDSLPVQKNDPLYQLINFAIPAILLLSIFLAFEVEISAYWDYRYFASTVYKTTHNNQIIQQDSDLTHYKTIWMLNFAMLFSIALSFVNILRIKSRDLGRIYLALSAFTLFAFLVSGLFSISELRESYLRQPFSDYYIYGVFNILIRYISLAFAGTLLYTIYRNTKREFEVFPDSKVIFELFFHVVLIWVSTSELLHWMEFAGFAENYKLALSIFWGLYALLLIILGIRDNKKHLRIGAMSLFGITLIKLFIYDMAHLGTISKTIVFVSLGVLLLIISFLYNKYKNAIFTDDAV